MVRGEEATILDIQQGVSSKAGVQRASGIGRRLFQITLKWSVLRTHSFRVSAVRPITDSIRTPHYVAEVPLH
jgi:hypothetical protein